MVKTKAGVEVVVSVTVIDAGTHEVIIPMKEYTYNVHPPSYAYGSSVLLAYTVRAMAELLYLNRLLNLYTRGDQILIARLKQPDWYISMKVLSGI